MKMMPPYFWNLFTNYLRVHPKDARRMWHAITRSEQPPVIAWRYELDSFAQRAGPLCEDDVRRFLRAVWSPHNLIKCSEALHEAGLLSRIEASRFEEKVLVCTGSDGAWKRTV